MTDDLTREEYGVDELAAMDPRDWVKEEYAALYEEAARRKQEPK